MISDEPNSDPNESISQFEIVKEIGDGYFSSVFLVQHQNQQSAMKVIPRERYSKGEDMLFLEAELRILQRTYHPHILKLQSILYDEKNVYILSEFCSNGTLVDLINSGQGLDEKESIRICFEILLGLEYLHSKKYCSSRFETRKYFPG